MPICEPVPESPTRQRGRRSRQKIHQLGNERAPRFALAQPPRQRQQGLRRRILDQPLESAAPGQGRCQIKARRAPGAVRTHQVKRERDNRARRLARHALEDGQQRIAALGRGDGGQHGIAKRCVLGAVRQMPAGHANAHRIARRKGRLGRGFEARACVLQRGVGAPLCQEDAEADRSGEAGGSTGSTRRRRDPVRRVEGAGLRQIVGGPRKQSSDTNRGHRRFRFWNCGRHARGASAEPNRARSKV